MGGALRMHLHVADTPLLVGWILSSGAAVRFVSSARLLERVRPEAKKIATQSGKMTPDVTPRF